MNSYQFSVREFKHNENKIEADFYILKEGKMVHYAGYLFKVSN